MLKYCYILMLVEVFYERYIMMKRIDVNDIIGRRSGILTVIAFLRKEPYNKKRGNYIYRCQCDCGNITEAKRVSLLTAHIKSCGCLKPENRLRQQHPSWKGHGDISSTMWKYFTNLAKIRKLCFEITIEQAWELFEEQKSLCALSGVPISFSSDTSSISPNTTASLDRIDSSKGYTLDNIQWLHKKINWMKQRYTQKEFIDWCCAVSACKGAPQ